MLWEINRFARGAVNDASSVRAATLTKFSDSNPQASVPKTRQAFLLSCLSWNWNFASGEITSPPQEDPNDAKEATFVQ